MRVLGCYCYDVVVAAMEGKGGDCPIGTSQMPRHRLPKPKGKKCQDIGYPKLVRQRFISEDCNRKSPATLLQGIVEEYEF